MEEEKEIVSAGVWVCENTCETPMLPMLLLFRLPFSFPFTRPLLGCTQKNTILSHSSSTPTQALTMSKQASTARVGSSVCTRGGKPKTSLQLEMGLSSTLLFLVLKGNHREHRRCAGPQNHKDHKSLEQTRARTRRKSMPLSSIRNLLRVPSCW